MFCLFICLTNFSIAYLAETGAIAKTYQASSHDMVYINDMEM
jgi:hypothetical protein